MNRARSIVFCVFMLLGTCARAEVIRLEVTRDTWLTGVGQQQEGNNGGSARLKFKGIQEFSVVDLDPQRLVGKTIANAELHLKSASADKLGRVTVSTLATEWAEGTGSGYAKQAGSASFRAARNGQTPWAFEGSDVTAVCLGQGGTIWRSVDATPPDKEEWQTIKIDPRLIGSRVAGISHGFVLMDDVGSEYERNGEAFQWKLFPNRYAFSREQNGAKPYFTVEIGGADREAPAAPAGIAPSDEALPAGEAVVEWSAGADDAVGFVARYSEAASFDWDRATAVPQYLVPAADRAGQRVRMHLRDLPLRAGQRIQIGVRAVDGAGNVSAVSTVAVVVSDQAPKVEIPPAAVSAFAREAELPKVGGVTIAAIDALDKVHPVSGSTIPSHPPEYLRANHLWSAADKTVRLFAARNEFVDVQFVLNGQAKSIEAKLAFEDGSAHGELFRFRHVETRAGPLPDPLVPVGGAFALPAIDEKVAEQKYSSLVADVYVPHDATPGVHRGTFTLTVDGQTLPINVELHVWNFTLPDVLSFVPEMNCYGLPDKQERAYYRLAHAHRTNLNRLGYNWRGEPADGCAPKWDGQQFAWEKYDRRFGPLLDGSAFADLPRKSVPVDFFYLPLNENWPVDLERHFKGGYWAESAFDAEYGPAFSEACGQFARHVKERGWTKPVFEFYLNNKVYFKGERWSRSSAPWVFDEPVNAQDFNALRFYGQLFQRGVAPFADGVNLGFRCDVSYPQWQRDFLDDVMDVNVCGGAFRQYHRLVMDRRGRTGEITFNYGSSNAIEDGNAQPAAWCIDTWCLGADGVVPWQTVGKAASWEKADPLSLFYPARAGMDGPVASARLKSYRRGQQDVEYLTLLQRVTGRPRFAVANAAREALKLTGTVVKRGEEDAGVVDYKNVDPAAMWALRVRVGAMLDAARPEARGELVERKVRGKRAPSP